MVQLAQRLPIAFLATILVAACSHGGGGGASAASGATVSGLTLQRTLSGHVRTASGSALVGVSVSIDADVLARTDAAGDFVIADPPPGQVVVEIDGRAASTGAARYSVVRVPMQIGAAGASILPRPIVLPDLEGPNATRATVTPDATGVCTSAIATSGSEPNLKLLAPSGVSITIGGEPATAPLEIVAVPLDRSALPVVARDIGLGVPDVVFAVAVEPFDASFEYAPNKGLSLIVPNIEALPLGWLTGVWHLEPDYGSWVQVFGEDHMAAHVLTSPNGQRVGIRDAVMHGGQFAVVVRAQGSCSTTIRGRAVDPLGAPLAGVSVAASSGPAALTDANGQFEINDVCAYVHADLPNCTATGVHLDFTSPVVLGSRHVTADIAAGSIVSGDITAIGDIVIDVPARGIVCGRVERNGQGLAGLVTISGATTRTLQSVASGRFFATGLNPGAHTASFGFTSARRTVSFVVDARAITTIEVQESMGGGTHTVNVLALFDDDGDGQTPTQPASGARVTLVGTDTVSSAGISAACNASGRAVFERVDGPYTATVQYEAQSGQPGDPGTRYAASVLDIDTPSGGTIGLLMHAQPTSTFPAQDAVIHGTVANVRALPAGESLFVRVQPRGKLPSIVGKSPVDPLSGAYTADVPSGVALDVVLVAGACPASAPCFPNLLVPSTVVLVPALEPLLPKEDRVVDFDLASPGRIAFDRTLALQLDHPPSPREAPQSSAVLDFERDDGSRLEFALWSGYSDPAVPASVRVPDAVALAAIGIETSLGFTTTQSTRFDESILRDCRHVLTGDETAWLVDLPIGLTIDEPGPYALLKLADSRDLTLYFTPSTGATSTDLTELVINAFSPADVRLQTTIWTIDVAGGANQIHLPPTAIPMWGHGAFVSTGLTELRVDGPPLVFAHVFDASVAANANALGANACSIGFYGGFEVR